MENRWNWTENTRQDVSTEQELAKDWGEDIVSVD